MKSKVAFSSMKMPKDFVAWLKVEAAKAGVPMYRYVLARFPSASRARRKTV